MMRNHWKWTTGLALLALLVTAGCGGGARKSEVTFHDQTMDFSRVQTVAVLPFINLSQVSQAADRTRDVFTTMLQATEAVYVLPPGEVERGIQRSSLSIAQEPTPEEVVKFAGLVGADAVLVGTVREYGEVRAGTTAANVISVSMQMMEAETGRTVWSASSTMGGIKAGDRLLGGGGRPMNTVTQRAVMDLLDKLFGN